MLPIVPYADRSQRLASILSRSSSFSPEVDAAVRHILETVETGGDAAVRAFSLQFDGVDMEAMRVPAGLAQRAFEAMDPEMKSVIDRAATNIRRFHERQVQQSWFADDGDGVVLGQRVLPMERVGLYVPGGTAFYPSSLLMNAIPAQVAGVAELVLVSPPQKEHDGWPHPLVLATAHYLGIVEIYAIGGAQAVAALAYGTESLQRVDKVVGPGNAWVASAKKQVYGRVDIDSVAGPSEIVVLADASANPTFVAADLLSQAEHDMRASAILVTHHRTLAEEVSRLISMWWPNLKRQEILERSLADYSACVVTESESQSIDLVNELAPEHLELMVADPWTAMTRIRHAGAVFLGPWSSEPVGDYFAGPNHVLPTGGTARYASALSVDDFIRKQSIIAYSRERLRESGPDIVRFAEAEALPAHAMAIRLRLESMEDRAAK